MALTLKGMFNLEQRKNLYRHYNDKGFLTGLSFCDWLKSYIRNNNINILKVMANDFGKK